MAEETLTLSIRVQPRASCNEIVGWKEGTLCVRLTAPPVDGAANRAVVEFMAGQLGLKRHQVTLVAGEKSRDKVLRLDGLTQEEMAARLETG